MKKIALIARREFLAAVANKGFVIGLLMMPALLVIFAAVGPRVFVPGRIDVRGDLVVIDPTARVGGELRRALDPDHLEAEAREQTQRALEAAPEAARGIGGSGQMLRNVFGATVRLQILERDGRADLEVEKKWLLGDRPEARRIGIVVIHPNAVSEADETAGLGTYDLYVASNLDGRVENVIHDGVRDAIVAARVRSRDLDPETMDRLMEVRRSRSTSVADGRSSRTVGAFNIVLPMTMAGLLVFGVMIGGQTLLTSTVEEKSSRVVEVLLSAVSPMELMAGKIIGQLAVSLLVLLLYAGLGLLVLVSFAVIGLLDPRLLVYFFVFFLITYALFGAVFAAAGAAVNDLKEAQTLMGPIILILMGPWMLAFPIARNPESTLATVLSFVPPVNAFVMMLRLASGNPPPAWQALLSIGIGIMAAVAAIWFAAKVFKIGLLLHGKPPSLRTLVRWARAA